MTDFIKAIHDYKISIKDKDEKWTLNDICHHNFYSKIFNFENNNNESIYEFKIVH